MEKGLTQSYEEEPFADTSMKAWNYSLFTEEVNLVDKKHQIYLKLMSIDLR